MLKQIKKQLMVNPQLIKLGKHTPLRLEKRGYSRGDIITAILNGKVIERQGPNKIVVAGQDKDENPIVVVIAKNATDYQIVTVMPPIDNKRFRECI